MILRLFKVSIGLLLLGVFVWIGMLTYFAGRGPTVVKTVEYFDVDALDREGLEAQFDSRLPVNLTDAVGATWWYVSWNWVCQVSLEVRIYLPRHTNLSGFTPTQRQLWAEFMMALKRHEHTHAYHGEQAAHEVAGNRCLGAPHVVRYWRAESELFDFRTNNGLTEGTQLKL